MKTIAIFEPNTLLGQELRERLAERSDLCRELKMLTVHPEQHGALSDFRGSAAMVESLSPSHAADLDLAFLCGSSVDEIAGIRQSLPEASLVALAGESLHAPSATTPVVAGANTSGARAGELILSPHASVIALTHLLHPLVGFRPLQASASILIPVSMREKRGMDELFEQTRAILSFQSKTPHEVLDRQLAFSLAPSAPAPQDLASVMSAVLGAGTEVTVQLIRAGVFHGLAVSLHLRCAGQPGAEDLNEALSGSPYVELVRDPEAPGLIDAAGEERVQASPVVPIVDRQGEFWLWGVMDNLLLGGALNALRIAERILAPTETQA
jgi:aspartate-semialdehyde dehydrogenase